MNTITIKQFGNNDEELIYDGLFQVVKFFENKGFKISCIWESTTSNGLAGFDMNKNNMFISIVAELHAIEIRTSIDIFKLTTMIEGLYVVLQGLE